MTRVTIPGLVSQLMQDGMAVARAEAGLLRAKISRRVAAARAGVILLIAAALVALLSLVGLVVGCVLALATLVGPGFAGLIVLLVGLIIAGILGWFGAGQLSAKPQPSIDPHPALEGPK